MAVIVDATYQNGAFKSNQPVSLPEGAKVRLTIRPIEEEEDITDQDLTQGSQATEASEAGEQGRPKPLFVWSKALYRARKAAQEFTKETHADY